MLTQCKFQLCVWASSVKEQQRKSTRKKKRGWEKSQNSLAARIFALSDNSQRTNCNNAVIKCVTCYFHHDVGVTVRIKEKHIPYITTQTTWKLNNSTTT